MTVLADEHAAHGATFTERSGRRAVAHYGRPARSHLAVRRVVGVLEHVCGVLLVEGDDRVAFLDNAVTNRVPTADGQGCYALLLDHRGRVETDMYVYNAAAGDRLLVFVPPGESGRLAEDWREKTFVQDVEISVATDELAVFGIYGPKATEKVASVLNGASSPDAPLTFVRGSMVDAGVTVVRDDGLTGEEGFLVVCGAGDAADVFDTLVNRGLNAAPFGYATWETLTLEAGTPLFESELRDRVANAAGVRNALDFEKGCYVGQEVVARVENRGRPARRLVGLLPDRVPETGAAVIEGEESVGAVTRAAESPVREEPLALAFLDAGCAADALTVRVDGVRCAATRATLPFVDGSDSSARLPRYPGE